MIRKIAIVLTVFGAIIFLFIYFIQKDKVTTKPNPIEANRKEIYQVITQLKNENTETSRIQLKVYQGFLCKTVGEACTENPSDGDVNVQGSILGFLSSAIAAPYAAPPASSIAWAQQGLESIGFVPKSYASTGLGFASLQGYMGIWKLFRDVAYLVLVLVMVAIGFMIMFRVNVGGQTVVNIESALPRIIIAMLLITLSFPIAGFLIDMMYAVISICVGLLYDAGFEATARNLSNTPISSKEALNKYITADFFNLWPEGANPFNVGTSLYKLTPLWVQTSLQFAILPLATGYGATLLKPVKEVVSSFFGQGAAGFTLGNLPNIFYAGLLIIIVYVISYWAPTIILGLILTLTILVLIFRIFFMLLESYIKVLLYTLFSPIILMFSAIPGNGSIGWWFKNMIGELVAFPTVIVILLVGNAINKTNVLDIDNPFLHMLNYAGATNSGGFEHAFRLPFLYGFQNDDFNLIVSFGLLLMIPDIIKLMKGIIGVQDSPLKIGLGSYFAGAALLTGIGGLAGQAQSFKQSAIGGNPEKGWMDQVGFMSPVAKFLRGK